MALDADRAQNLHSNSISNLLTQGRYAQPEVGHGIHRNRATMIINKGPLQRIKQYYCVLMKRKAIESAKNTAIVTWGSNQGVPQEAGRQVMHHVHVGLWSWRKSTLKITVNPEMRCHTFGKIIKATTKARLNNYMAIIANETKCVFGGCSDILSCLVLEVSSRYISLNSPDFF